MIIAIDGPAGAGKSTVGEAIARALSLRFLDTGAMYRALTLTALRRGIDPADPDGCSRLARTVSLCFDGAGKVLVDGEVCEPAIRGEEVTRRVSDLSLHPGVRAAVVERQRALAREWGGLVAEGRDTTTVVFPDAEHKFFLIASARERARRRAAQLGTPERALEILADIERRDFIDSTRAHSPLVRAADAVLIDGDELDAAGVVAEVLTHVRGDRARQPEDPGERPRAGTSIPERGREASSRSDPDAAPPLVQKTLTYRAVRFSVLLLSRTLFCCRIEGREHVPASGPVVLAANHRSLIDIPLLAQAVRRHVCFVARDTLAQSRWLELLMSRCGAVLIRPGTPDRGAMRRILAHLEHGDCVAVFPEGTRSRDGRLLPFRGGALVAARRAGAPVVPVAIRGSGEAWPLGARLPRLRRVTVRFGAPVRSDAADALQRVESAVRAMLPPEEESRALA